MSATAAATSSGGTAGKRLEQILARAEMTARAHFGEVASVIAGATRPEQLEQNVKAGNWQVTAEELAEIGRIGDG